MTEADSKSSRLTPLMRQFYAIKDTHPDKILFFRMGDFFEMFGDDAVKAAPILGIALTSRSHGADGERIPLAGVPHHSADRYLAKLLAAGQKVVVVEQTEDPRTAKGIVKRDIVEILTPGTATVEGAEGQSRTGLLAVTSGQPDRLGIASLDLDTGSFVIDEGPAPQIIDRIKLLEPAEIVCPTNDSETTWPSRLALPDSDIEFSEFGDWNFELATARRELNQHFGTSTLDGFGIGDCRLGVTAAGAVLRYLRENHREQLGHVNRLVRPDSELTMSLDHSTVRNLELTHSIATGSEQYSLLAAVDRTVSVPGHRRLRQALLNPFKAREPIEKRLGAVAELVQNRILAGELADLLKTLPDLEQLAGRLGMGKLSPRQAAAIGKALTTAQSVRRQLAKGHSQLIVSLQAAIPDTAPVSEQLSKALVEEPPLIANKGNIFQYGYAPELDKLNDSIKDARLYIASLQAKERERTGITTLKVGYNKVFGYYLEVTKANTDLVPDNYIRKQTLVNAERYITQELKEHEDLIVSAEEKIFDLEETLYRQLVMWLQDFIADILSAAHAMAEVDLLRGLADLATASGYCRPTIYDDTRLRIVAGRHPVIETVLAPGSFAANDSEFAEDSDAIVILTGPNMSGKSTYLRQIGLIVLLAQIGSFVPADEAEIGLVDRIFTRVGALDNLAQGQSTFLVEMVETANILHNATDRSLVLLDEVGRGTSTFDGLSIAWAVVENINDKIGARTVFATHYHELTGMAALYPKVKNYQVAVKRWEDKVVFLHQIVPGGCDDSYGIEVGRLAGLPRATLTRAKQILRLLESGKFNQSELGQGIYQSRVQPSLFDPQPSQVESRIAESDPDNMTPMQALELLRQLKQELS